MADPRHLLGRRAEDAAADWLARRGWEVIVRRHRTQWGELDLVCRDPRGELVGVEVKLRSSERAGSGAESLDRRRVGRLRRSLAAFAAAQPVRSPGLRIDLITVTRAGDAWRLRHHRAVDAW